ncbi:hypothetical protein LEP1GSC193_1128 [Leptospira alstonii serovar Pingchang str. 80-412]|uniref:Uncharacterized protein n=2 Tax=Leptospira alstonii TaxID=28452 RepID=M6D7E2_9LEPT|nr:hypothetical protein LEP1GSC194_2843 [Leptospira alstonii serovar Sichuan str. 79601]EQA82626.1 hypothetical protein LEP1GSC193_1128 [Leptospira alstonii serovar Pingchang str. 80-412]
MGTPPFLSIAFSLKKNSTLQTKNHSNRLKAAIVTESSRCFRTPKLNFQRNNPSAFVNFRPYNNTSLTDFKEGFKK